MERAAFYGFLSCVAATATMAWVSFGLPPYLAWAAKVDPVRTTLLSVFGVLLTAVLIMSVFSFFFRGLKAYVLLHPRDVAADHLAYVQRHCNHHPKCSTMKQHMDLTHPGLL